MSTVFRVILEGDQEVPPRDTTASGVGTVVFDDAAIAASYSFDVQGLDFGPATGQTPTPDPNDNVTRTHFHTAVAGVNGPIVFGQIDTVDPAFEQDDDDLDVVLNADGSWSVSGVWDQDDPPRAVWPCTWRYNRRFRRRSRFGHGGNGGKPLLQCPFERFPWGRNPGSAGRHRR